MNTAYVGNNDERFRLKFLNSCVRDCFTQELESLTVKVFSNNQAEAGNSNFPGFGFVWPKEYLNYDITELCMVDNTGSVAQIKKFPRDFRNNPPLLKDYHVSLDQACLNSDFLPELYLPGIMNADVNNISMIVGTVFSGVLVVVYVVQLIVLLTKGTVQPIFERPRGYY